MVKTCILALLGFMGASPKEVKVVYAASQAARQEFVVTIANPRDVKEIIDALEVLHVGEEGISSYIASARIRIGHGATLDLTILQESLDGTYFDGFLEAHIFRDDSEAPVLSYPIHVHPRFYEKLSEILLKYEGPRDPLRRGRWGRIESKSLDLRK